MMRTTLRLTVAVLVATFAALAVSTWTTAQGGGSRGLIEGAATSPEPTPNGDPIQDPVPAPAPDGVDESGDITAPVVALDRYEMRPGDRVTVTIAGFQAPYVTISVCGNEARRGSSDCNMTASEGVGLNGPTISTIAQLPLAAPPAPCPCILRVSSAGNDEIAVAAINMIGHPTAPVVGGAILEQTLSVALQVQPADEGLWDWTRSSLCGSKTYDVTVILRNRSSSTLESVQLKGSVGDDETHVEVDIPYPAVGIIPAGATVERTLQITLPAPVYGSSVWQVDAIGAGPTVTAATTTSHLPGLLIVLLVLFVLDMLVLLIRYILRRRDRRRMERQRVAEQRANARPPIEVHESERELVDAATG